MGHVPRSLLVHLLAGTAPVTEEQSQVEPSDGYPGSLLQPASRGRWAKGGAGVWGDGEGAAQGLCTGAFRRPHCGRAARWCPTLWGEPGAGVGWAVAPQEGPGMLLVGCHSCLRWGPGTDAPHRMPSSPWAALICALVSLPEMGNAGASLLVCPGCRVAQCAAVTVLRMGSDCEALLTAPRLSARLPLWPERPWRRAVGGGPVCRAPGMWRQWATLGTAPWSSCHMCL